MTVPMENIVGAASSDQMVGGHRGLGMLNNVLNDPWRKLGRGGGGMSAKQQAKLMQYQSQLSREELAHAANIDHGQKIETFKDGGFLQQGIRHSTVGIEYDENGDPAGSFVGKDSTTGGSPWGGGNTPSAGQSEDGQPSEQAPSQASGPASRRVATQVMGGKAHGIQWGGSDQISPQFNLPALSPQSPEPEPETPAEPFSGTRTLIPSIFDNRGATVQANEDGGGFTAIPGRADRVEHNANARKRVEQANAFNVAEAQRSHMERTGAPLPDDIALEVGSRQNTLTVPTAQSIEYDKQAAAGKPGFDRTADDEKSRILNGPKAKKPSAGGTPQGGNPQGGGTAGMGPAAPAAGGGEGVGSALLEGGVKGIAAGVGGALGGPVGAAIAGGVAQAGIQAVKGRKKRPVQGTPVSKSTSAETNSNKAAPTDTSA